MWPKVTIVDRDDNLVGADTFQSAIDNEKIRRIIRVFLVNDDGKIFLQRRSKEVVVYPDVWDHATSGHVDEGEEYEEAARRELKEEIGLDLPVQEIGKVYIEEPEAYPGKTLRGWHKIFLAHSKGEKVQLAESEVSGGEWFSPEEIDAMVEENPRDFTGGFLLTWEKYSDLFRK
ncbi:MAG: NUDIX domain-containing protein [Parcubacteria group bacterium]|nr:NUDIX domain-containing protein [Parcubacteria group bacterium]